MAGKGWLFKCFLQI